MIDTAFTAAVQFAHPPEETRASCGNCDWKGTADELADIGEAILTPGDASPAGRCPDCGQLAYVDPDQHAGSDAKPSGLSPYTVLLLRPDYATDNFGQDTYMTCVQAESPEDAVSAAQWEVYGEDNPNPEVSDDEIGDHEGPYDYFVLAVFAGEHSDINPG